MGFGAGAMGPAVVLTPSSWAGPLALIVQAAGRPFPCARRDDPAVARETLRRRYAASEIGAAAYEQAREAIG